MKTKTEKEKNNSLSTILTYCKKYYLIIIIALIFAAVSAVLSVIGPNYISQLTETITDGISFNGINIDMDKITNIGVTLVIIYVVSMLLGYAQSYIMAHVSCKVGKNMRSDISSKINRIPLKYFDCHNQGDTLSRVTNDVDTITQSLNMSVGTLVSSAATLIGCVVMMFITEWRMAITAIVASLIGFALMGLVMSKSQKHFNKRQDSLALVNSHVEEYYAGQNIVRAYNGEESNLKIFQKANEELRKNTFSAEFLSGLMMPMMTFIGNLGYVAVCIVGAVLAFNGSIAFSVVVAFMIYIRLFTSPLGQIGQGFSSIQSALAASNRVGEFLKEEELEKEVNKDQLENVKGNIEFNHIKFGYNPDKNIIKDFSFKVNAGEKVAIVGPTGAGKTTIVNLLMRFYELNGGSIIIDGKKSTDLTRENIHDIFGMVLQDTWLFEGTLRDNLTYGKTNISDEKLLEILNECGLSHFVSTLPNGLDTILNDNVSVSAGQKQLLTIARTMVKNAPLVILDEATSSVDTRTENKIQEAMDKISKGRTSFVIAHRLSTIKNADKIIYMQNGDIKEVGTHNELLAKNGLYADLYNSQFALS